MGCHWNLNQLNNKSTRVHVIMSCNKYFFTIYNYHTSVHGCVSNTDRSPNDKDWPITDLPDLATVLRDHHLVALKELKKVRSQLSRVNRCLSYLITSTLGTSSKPFHIDSTNIQTDLKYRAYFCKFLMIKSSLIKESGGRAVGRIKVRFKILAYMLQFQCGMEFRLSNISNLIVDFAEPVG